MKYIKEYFNVDIISGDNLIYRKYVAVSNLLRAYRFLDHNQNWDNNYQSNFDELLKELFFDKNIDMYCTSINCRKRVKFKVKNVYYNISMSTNRPTIVFKSQKAQHFIDMEYDEHLIFINSSTPFEVGKWEKEFDFQNDVKKYNL